MKTLTKPTSFVGELCDSCGTDSVVRAQVRVDFKNGPLLFCNHCYEKMEPQLLACAIGVEKRKGGQDEPPNR